MDKKKFLAYILYITLLEIREEAYKKNDSKFYHLTDMMHNIPFSLLNEGDIDEQYENIIKTVQQLGISDWLSKREEEFIQRFPKTL